MKQALLITAYKNIHHLRKIIDFFDDRFNLYIHIDKKSEVSEEEIKSLNSTGKKVFISRKFKTNWGGTAHLKCTLLLLKEALKEKENNRFHLISGHDFPIKSNDEFCNFFETNSQKEFIEYFSLPSDKWENGGMDRLKYYNLYDLINAKSKYGTKIIHKLIRIQKKIGIKRKIKSKAQIYGGSTWWSLSRACCEYIWDQLKNDPAILKQYNYSFCAEEIFFQTMVLNSPFNANTVNNNLRFILWELRNGNMPAVLDETDINALKESSHFFARRFEYPASEKLMQKLIF